MATAMNVATEANDFASAMPEEVDPHVTIGVDPDDLAIGINPSEFLEWIGTWVFVLLNDRTFLSRYEGFSALL